MPMTTKNPRLQHGFQGRQEPGRLSNGGYLKGSGRGVLSEDGGRMGNWKLG